MRNFGAKLLMALIAMACVTSIAAGSSVTVDSRDVSPGDTFTIDVTIDPQVKEIYGAQYDLTFNQSILQVISQTKGNFLSQDGETSVEIVNKFNNTIGKLEYGETRMGADGGVTGAGVLASIIFEAVSEGSTDLEISNVILSDPSAKPISGVVLNDGIVNVGGSSQPLIDLTPTALNIPDSIYADHDYTLAATISNLESGDASAFNATLKVDGVVVDEERVGGLSGNSDTSVSFSWRPETVGSCTLLVETDSDNEISETDEFNNSLTAIVDVLESTGDPAPYLVTYTITNTTISPNGDGIKDDTEIDVEFSEPVDAAIRIENTTGIIRSLYTSSSKVTDPTPKIWDGTDDGGNIVADGTYQVNVTMDDGVNPIVHDNSRSIRVTNNSVATIAIGNVSGNTTVPIIIENAVNVGSVDITLTYNASVCTITDVANGTFDWTFANLEHNETGWVRIGAIHTEESGLCGSIILANVTFRSNSTNGTSQLNMSVTTLKDATPQCNEIPYIVQNGTYTAVLNGDVNGDDAVNIIDAMYLAKHVLGIAGFEEIIVGAADVDGDGVIDIADAMYLAKHVLGKSGFEELR